MEPLTGTTLGDRVREVRELQGVSLTALAARAMLSKGYLSQLESGKIPKPGAANIQRIAVALGVDVDYLLTGDDPPEQPEIPPELRALYLSLTAAEREVINELVRQRDRIPDGPDREKIFAQALEVAMLFLKGKLSDLQ